MDFSNGNHKYETLSNKKYHFEDHQKTEPSKDPMRNQICRVCDEPAAGYHFGAFTCEGCKSFFGRTCGKSNLSSISECKNNNACVIDKKNRTSCKACRLRKCLSVGMSKAGSRYGRRSNWFKMHCVMQNGPAPREESRTEPEENALEDKQRRILSALSSHFPWWYLVLQRQFLSSYENGKVKSLEDENEAPMDLSQPNFLRQRD